MSHDPRTFLPAERFGDARSIQRSGVGLRLDPATPHGQTSIGTALLVQARQSVP